MTKRKRRRQPTARGPIEVRQGGKRWHCYDIGWNAPAGIVLIMVDRQIVLPVTKPIEIFGAVGQMEVPRYAFGASTRPAPYDPQLPHNFEGNLTLQQLADREERQKQAREQEVQEMRARRNAELEDAANANGSGLPPFMPALVGNG